MHKLPTPCILQSGFVGSFSIEKYYACNNATFFTVLALSQMQSHPVSCPIPP